MQTVAEISALAAHAASYNSDHWSEWVPVGEGTDARVRMAPDLDTSIQDSPDCFGTFAEGRRNETRPNGFNGAARKVRTRYGYLWWQPPADLTAEGLRSVAESVEGYYLDEWSYVGVNVEVRRPPCACCGNRKTDSSSLWGIESNAEASHFAEVIGDLLSDLIREN